jgi:hypothetical protein
VGHYVMGRDGEHVRVIANNPTAKEVLFGWAGDYGSTKDPGAIELYGQARPGAPWRGDLTEWVWKLSPAGVRSLRRSLCLGLKEPERFEVSELLAKLRRVLAAGASRARSR